jgi:hypothetical protein
MPEVGAIDTTVGGPDAVAPVPLKVTVCVEPVVPELSMT